MSSRLKYSVVVPVFNSSNSLVELCQRIHIALKNFQHQIVLVDDGSADNSWGVINSIAAENPEKITAIRFMRNYGQHSAILCGFSFCDGDFIITIDDDLQHPPEEINKLIARQEQTNADVVYGIYTNKQHSAMRNAGSFYVRKTAVVAEGNPGYGSSFRLIKRVISDKVIETKASSFYYLDEMLYWYTSSFAQVDVVHDVRKHGESGYTLFKLFSMYSDVVFNYSSFPLRLMTYAGFVFSFLTFSSGMFILVKRLFYRGVFGYAALMIVVLFTASVLMFCMGIIGQYLFKIYQSQHGKPMYSIREIKKP